MKINKAFGSIRFTYNHFLNEKIEENMLKSPKLGLLKERYYTPLVKNMLYSLITFKLEGN